MAAQTIQQVNTGWYDKAKYSADGSLIYADLTPFSSVSGSYQGLPDSWSLTASALDVTADGRYLILPSSQLENQQSSGNTTLSDVVVFKYDLVTGATTEYRTTVVNRGPVVDVEVLNDGTVLLAPRSLGPGDEGELPLTRLDLATGTFTTLATPLAAFSSIVSSAEGNLLLAVGGRYSQETIAVLDSHGNALATRKIDGHVESGFIGGVAISATGNSIVVEASNGLFLYDTQLNLKRDLQPELAAKLGVTDLSNVAFSADGTKLYVASPDAHAVFEVATSDWSVLRGFALGAELRDMGTPDGLVLSPGGRYLMAQTLYNAVRIDLTTNNQIDGTPGSDTFAGTAYPDLIYGGAGNDRFEASAGADTLFGGTGDDTYLVNDVNDVVLERANEGTDTIVTSVAYTLPANVEALRLASGAVATLTAGPGGGTLFGNEFGTLLVGGMGIDVLNGGRGDDILRGGTGDIAEFADSIANARFELRYSGIPFTGENLVVTSADGRDVIEDIRIDIVNPTQHTGISTLRFNDATISVSNLLATRLALTSAFDRTPTSEELSKFAKLVTSLPTSEVAAAIRANPDVGTAVDQRIAALYLQYEDRLPTAAERTAAHDRILADGNYYGLIGALHETPAEPVAGFRFFLPDHFGGAIGGSGTVYGAQGDEHVRVWDMPGTVRFDVSFNKGGDTISLAGNQAEWSISQSGSSVVLTRGEAAAIIPVGPSGTYLGFDDHALILHVDSQTVMIGDQVVNSIPAPIIGQQGPFLGDDVVDFATSTARLFLAPEADTLVYGAATVFGTPEADHLTIVGDKVVLDASFNRGGDTVTIQDYEDRDYVTLVRSGSSIIVSNPGALHVGLEVTIPVGTAGLTLELGGDAHRIAYNVQQDAVLFDDMVVGTTPVTYEFG